MLTVIETPSFTSLASGRLSAQDVLDLTAFLAAHPAIGDLIPGAGGARKLRWAVGSRGKSGGARVITYWHCDGCPVHLLAVYLKNERANLTRAEVNAFKTLCKEIAREHQEP